jgi:ankyrin repeat protein
MQLLDSPRIDINDRDMQGAKAVYRAAQNGREAAIRMLLTLNADVNIKTKLDQTPLLGAAESGHEAVAKLLLEIGAGWLVKDYLEWSPVYEPWSKEMMMSLNY